jgi:hypothetical protein
MFPFRRTIYGGIVFGVLVLTGIYYAGKNWKTDDGEPATTPIVDNRSASAEPQAAVLETIRSRAHAADPKVEIVQWWPPRRVMLNGTERFACRAVYQVDDGGAKMRRDGAFDVEGPSAVPVQDGIEGAATHRRLDPLFPCENCPFSKEKQKK